MLTGLSLASKNDLTAQLLPRRLACVLCFPPVFRTTDESILGRSENCLFCQFLEWKLQIDYTVKRVHLEWTYFDRFSVLLVDRKSLFCKLVLLATQVNYWTHVESERYSDYFNPRPDISNDTFPKKLKPGSMIEFIGAIMQEHSVELIFQLFAALVICFVLLCFITCN